MKADGWVVFFTLVGMLALGGNIWALHAAVYDRRHVRWSGRNGILLTAASQAVYRELRRVVGQMLLVVGGIVGLFAMQPPEPYASSTARIILRFVFVLFQVMLAEAAFADFVGRRRVLEADAATRRETPPPPPDV